MVDYMIFDVVRATINEAIEYGKKLVSSPEPSPSRSRTFQRQAVSPIFTNSSSAKS